LDELQGTQIESGTKNDTQKLAPGFFRGVSSTPAYAENHAKSKRQAEITRQFIMVKEIVRDLKESLKANYVFYA
jgi:hypothetical protein